MKKQISPVVAGVVIGIIVLFAAGIIWKGMQKDVKLPDKPPSGPIILPPSQQGRTMPSGQMSGMPMHGSQGQ